MMLAVEIIFLHLIIKLPPFTTNNILLDNAVVIYKQQELQSDILTILNYINYKYCSFPMANVFKL